MRHKPSFASSSAMNDSTRTAPPSRDSLTLFALAAGLAMGHVVVALAESAARDGLALPAAIVFLVCGSAAVLCSLAAVPRPRWVAPRFARWTTAARRRPARRAGAGAAVLTRVHQKPSSTSSAARISARAFASVSCHSSSGTESATTPAAACT